MNLKPFLTGSHAYGTPTAESDVDLVVLVDNLELRKLIELKLENADPKESTSAEGACTASLRFGELNLILTHREDIFRAWQCATENLKSKAPVTRETAVAEIKLQLGKI